MRNGSAAGSASGRRGFLASLGGLAGAALLSTRNRVRAQDVEATPVWTPPPIPEPLPSSEGTPPPIVGEAPEADAPVSGAPTSIEQPSAAGTPGAGESTPTTGGEFPATNPQQPAQPLATPVVEDEPEVTPAVTVVLTGEFTFDPNEVTIRVGEAVEWRNEGRSPQTVTADPSLVQAEGVVILPEGAEPFDSAVINNGETFVHAFETPGEYQYVSLPQADNGMTGRVIVEP
jgi:plastocyanin